jgi:hypothetical protein
MQTDEDDEIVRSFLAEVPLPDGRLDLPNLLDTGQRRVRRRRVGQFGLAALVAVAVAGAALTPQLLRSPSHRQQVQVGASSQGKDPASPAPSTAPATGAQCRITNLAVPAGLSDVSATTVDPTGRYIGGHGTKGQNFTPVLWTDGVPKVLPIQRASAEVDSVNASGVAVGLASTKAYDDVYRYQNGKVTFLKPPPGNWHVYPWPAINAGGDIVINAEPVGSYEGANSFAFYWPAGSDTAVRIPLPEGANVYAISDSRVLVGAIYKDGLAVAGYTWDLTGKGMKLETPAGATSVGYAIRGDWVAGSGGTGKGNGFGALWDLRTGELTKLPQGVSFNSVNAQGWAAMETEVWAAGTIRPLESPLATNIYRGLALSDTGLVVGSATPTRDSADSPARATPVSWQC